MTLSPSAGRAWRWDASRDAIESVACPLCAEPRRTHVYTDRGWKYGRCRSCAHVYLSPRPSAEMLERAYAHYLPSSCREERAWRARYAPVIAEALDALGAPGRLLEVGSGYGHLLEAARARGWQAEGIDVAPAGDARTGCIADTRSDAHDAVVAMYVLEHIPDPRAFLGDAARALVPGGRLLLRVPDTTPLVRALRPFGAAEGLYHAPWHLHDFSPVRLTRLLEEEGFPLEQSWSGAQGWGRAVSPWMEGMRGTSRWLLARRPT